MFIVALMLIFVSLAFSYEHAHSAPLAQRLARPRSVEALIPVGFAVLFKKSDSV